MFDVSINVAWMKRSATLAINEKVNALKEKGETVYHLGFGESPFQSTHVFKKRYVKMPIKKVIFPRKEFFP